MVSVGISRLGTDELALGAAFVGWLGEGVEVIRASGAIIVISQ